MLVPPVLIALHRGQGIISTLIRWQQRGKFSHASLVFPSMGVIEAREGFGVRLLPAIEHRRGETHELFTVRDLTDAVADTVWEFARGQLGKPYDWTMVLRFISRRQESRKSRGKWFCSELVYASFQKAGVDLLRDTDPWEVSPGLLARSPLLTPYHP